jgi:deoxyribodipyrimidine photo-lyase
LESCYDWARETLRVHAADERAVIYTQDQLEQGMTHDDLWNASQLQMVKEGKMHVRDSIYFDKRCNCQLAIHVLL